MATSAERVEELSDQAQSSASIIDQMLTAFAGVALFVGGFVVVNTFTMMVAQRTRELALLRALGASRRQIRRAVLIEAVAIGFIGSVVGIVVGVLLAFVILALMNSLGFDLPDTGLVFGVRVVFVPLLIGVVVTVVASYLPARRASAVPPVAAMRDVETPSRSPRRRYMAGVILLLLGLVTGLVGVPLLFIGVALLAPLVVPFLGRTVGALARRFGGFSGRLGQENAVRDPRRTASTASALMVGLAFVVAMTVMFNSALASFTNALDDSVKADVIVDSGDQGITPEVARKLSSRTELGVVSPQRYGEFELVGEGTEFLSAVDPETFSETLDVDVTEGSIEDLAEGGVVVSEQRAEDDGLAMGDVLEMRFARTGVRKLPIVGIYADDALYSEGFLVGLDTYVANFTDQRDTRVLINGAEGVSTEETLATVEEVAVEFPNVDVNDQSGYKAAITKEVDQLLAVAAGLLGLAVLIAAARRRQHADAVDRRAHPRARPAAGGRDVAWPAAGDDHLGVDDHRRHRRVARPGDRDAARQVGGGSAWRLHPRPGLPVVPVVPVPGVRDRRRRGRCLLARAPCLPPRRSRRRGARMTHQTQR